MSPGGRSGVRCVDHALHLLGLLGSLTVDANVVSQDSAGVRGIHLMWCGPRAWVYAPDGFTVQRRVARPSSARDCERLDDAAIAVLRQERERRLRFGVVTLREGGWLHDLDNLDGPVDASRTPTEVFRLDLDGDRHVVEVSVDAQLSFVAALYDGRVVGASGPQTGPAQHRIRAPRFDTAIVHTVSPTSLRVCVDLLKDPTAGAIVDWNGVVPIVKGLTLPLRELMPSLHSDTDELAEARRRLLPGEQIGAPEFFRLTDVVRPLLKAVATGSVRPSALALLIRPDAASDADEARALDPLWLMLAHPTWRRALGFGFLDDDPVLVPGESYEYRVSATYPADVQDSDHGFAAVPSATLLPCEFALAGPRLRVPRPVTVTHTPGTTAAGLVRMTRRGIELNPTRESFWTGTGLDGWSLVVDFAVPVSSVVLDLAPGHDLEVSAGDPIGPFTAVDAVPPNPTPRLDFAAPVEQLRLRGKGFLHAIRVPSTVTNDKTLVDVVVPPVVFADTALPTAPIAASAESLQQPTVPPTDLVPTTDVARRDALGFTVTWRPAAAFGLTAWPPDADAAVPLDAAVFQVERRAEPDGDWTALVDDGNEILGDRSTTPRALTLAPGVDLATVFPDDAVDTSGADLELRFVDTFESADDAPDGAHAPKPGTLHRYRVRAIDAIGRPSTQWRETAPVHLEKHVPPPLPVRVDARVLVPDAPDLTADELALLGAHRSAIVLRWSWGPEQQRLDPFVTEFRVYAAPPHDTVAGTVTVVSMLTAGQVTTYRVDVQLDRVIAEDLLAGRRLDAGHPFFIRSHGGGDTIEMLVETRLRLGGVAPVPIVGPVSLSVPLTPDRARPPAWGARLRIEPVHSDPTQDTYEVVLFDLLDVTDTVAIATMWVGISAADAEGYVADQLDPLDDRPGNESAIVAVQATARYHGRPVLDIPAPLAPVPRLPTPEPGSEPLHFPLDLSTFLPAPALAVGSVRTERVAVATILAACRLTGDDRILALPVPLPGSDMSSGEPEVEIEIANPTDRVELAAELRAGADVDDRFVVFLAGHHSYRDRLFVPVAGPPQPPGPFAETLPPSTGRYLYRVRAVDAAGHVSAGSALAAVVVRVPSLRPGPPPQKVPSLPGDPPGTLRVRVAADPSLAALIVFIAPVTHNSPVAPAQVMRVPNRSDLAPGDGLFLRSPDGALLTPTLLPLGAAVDALHEVLVPVPGDPGDRIRVWVATLTVDGVASPVAGPYSLVHPIGGP